MDKQQYNHNYYERHKEEIKVAQKLRRTKPTPASIEAHRKAARAYYHLSDISFDLTQSVFLELCKAVRNELDATIQRLENFQNNQKQ